MSLAFRIAGPAFPPRLRVIVAGWWVEAYDDPGARDATCPRQTPHVVLAGGGGCLSPDDADALADTLKQAAAEARSMEFPP